MTREEAKGNLIHAIRWNDIPKKEALEMAIKALDVLDKIRAEIASYKDDKLIHAERNEMIDIVLDIIDKYRESEDKG